MSIQELRDELAKCPDSELRDLNDFIVKQLRRRMTRRDVQAISSLNEGDTVRTLGTSKWSGLTGKIVSVRQTKVVVETTRGRVQCPAGMIEKIQVAA